MSPIVTNYIKAWLEKAEHDVISAQRLLEIEPIILDNACFHCQQAIEKYLKAYLIYNGVEVERTHDIIFLLSQCADFDQIFREIDPLNINVYAVKGRYPHNAIMPELEEAQQYYQLALQVRELVLDRLILN
jgi:HEPN domain-containing protein